MSRAGPAVLAALLAAVPPAAGDAWRRADPGRPWSFPEDHWAHPEYASEWWYFTGHLESVDEPGRRFGFQFTFFRIGLLPEAPAVDSRWNARALIMGHAAIGDPAAGRHHYSELLYRAAPPLGGFNRPPADAIAWSRGPAGTGAPWTLHWNGEGFDLSMRDGRQGMGLQLSTRPLKPPVRHGRDGYSPKGTGQGAGASHYYSFTRLRTEGTLTVEGREHRVAGESWMDKEFGTSQLRDDQVGWDWFSLQLDDGRELMIYEIRDRDGAVDHASGTLVAASGEAAPLSAGDFSTVVEGRWRSPETGADYPSGWTVEVPAAGLRLRVEPWMEDQENRSRATGGLFYWEGAARVLDPGGEPVGRAYVELVGYGEGNRPAL